MKYSTYEKYRSMMELTDYNISKQTGIATSTLSEWKHGSYTLKLDKQLRIAEILGIPAELVLETDTPEEMAVRRNA